VLASILVFFGRIWDVLVVFVWSTCGVYDMYLWCACGVFEAYLRRIWVVFVAYLICFGSVAVEKGKRPSLVLNGALSIGSYSRFERVSAVRIVGF
jgi:hypothetical protein